MAISKKKKQEVYDYYVLDLERHLKITQYMALLAPKVVSIDVWPFVEAKGPELGTPATCDEKFRETCGQTARDIIKKEHQKFIGRLHSGLTRFERELLKQRLENRDVD